MKIIICMQQRSYSESIIDPFDGQNGVDFTICISLAESFEKIPLTGEYKLVVGSFVLPGILFRGSDDPLKLFIEKSKERNPNGELVYYHSNESVLPKDLFGHYLNYLDGGSHKEILKILGYKKLRG